MAPRYHYRKRILRHRFEGLQIVNLLILIEHTIISAAKPIGL
jgi:hypothetical protein